MVGALGYGMYSLEPLLGSNGTYLSGLQGSIAKWAAWTVYWTLAGWVFTGIWICGHEAGHRAFSTSTTVNDAWGLFLHTFVLVPYHAWRISHSKHHAATGHMTRDEVFVPATRSSKLDAATGRKVTVAPGIKLDELLEDAPAYRLFWLLVQQLFGWHAYLFSNASGQPWYPKFTNHFLPSSPVFEPRHFNYIVISDVALAVMGFALYKFGQYMGGWVPFIKYYGIPYICVNHWLVMITYLQHTDPNIPHYSAAEWTFARGALATIDRNMLGPVGPYLMHGITETHVCHHLVSCVSHFCFILAFAAHSVPTCRFCPTARTALTCGCVRGLSSPCTPSRRLPCPTTSCARRWRRRRVMDQPDCHLWLPCVPLFLSLQPELQATGWRGVAGRRSGRPAWVRSVNGQRPGRRPGARRGGVAVRMAGMERAKRVGRHCLHARSWLGRGTV